jgi:hypothetical protein
MGMGADLAVKGAQPQAMRNRLWLEVQIDDVFCHAGLHATYGVLYILIPQAATLETEMELVPCFFGRLQGPLLGETDLGREIRTSSVAFIGRSRGRSHSRRCRIDARKSCLTIKPGPRMAPQFEFRLPDPERTVDMVQKSKIPKL